MTEDEPHHDSQKILNFQRFLILGILVMKILKKKTVYDIDTKYKANRKLTITRRIFYMRFSF